MCAEVKHRNYSIRAEGVIVLVGLMQVLTSDIIGPDKLTAIVRLASIIVCLCPSPLLSSATFLFFLKNHIEQIPENLSQKVSSAILATSINMASQSESQPHENGNDPFEQLPKDILLPMVKLTSDLATIWSLSRASRAVYLLIDEFGKEIFETVLNASEPKRIRTLIGPIALLKLGMHPSRSLDEFKERYNGGWNNVVRNWVNDPEAKDIPRDKDARIDYPFSLLPEGISVTVIHTILREAYNISRLTHLCHKHFLDRCEAFEFSELLRARFTCRGCFLDLEKSECRKYFVRDTGPVSWMEEKRIALGFWFIQMFYDLKNGSPKLQWTTSDLDVLRSMNVEGFFEEQAKYCPILNSFLTALLYL